MLKLLTSRCGFESARRVRPSQSGYFPFSGEYSVVIAADSTQTVFSITDLFEWTAGSERKSKVEVNNKIFFFSLFFFPLCLTPSFFWNNY
jgi:hypothetical protein